VVPIEEEKGKSARRMCFPRSDKRNRAMVDGAEDLDKDGVVRRGEEKEVKAHITLR